MDHYNLLDKDWIPVLWKDGRVSRIGIREALEKAHRIRQISATNPMDRVAILRFLLALLYWCAGNPPPDRELTSAFPGDWFKKLEEHQDCFNLLGPGKRFYQDQAARRTRPATVLIQEVPSGHNFWHLKHSTDNQSALCPSCCALGLLRLPIFAVSGLSGPGEPNLMAGINGVPPLYVFPLEKSLHETLMANWAPCPVIGEPSWAGQFVFPGYQTEVPILTGLTLLPRRVFLHEPVRGGEACIACGSRALPLIHTCEYQTAGKQESDKWRDPHAVYVEGEKRKSMRAVDLMSSGRFRMDRPWTDLVARLLETGKASSLLVVGFATHQAKNIDVWERSFDLRTGSPVSETEPAQVKNWRLQGWGLEKKLEKATRSEAEGAALTSLVRPHVEAKVSENVSELVTGGADAWEQASSEYRPMMAALARSLSPGATTSALRRRRQIELLRPNMRPKAQAGGEAKRKKGGGIESNGTVHSGPDPTEIW